MTVFVHSIVMISFKFLFVDHLGPTATLTLMGAFVTIAGNFDFILCECEVNQFPLIKMAEDRAEIK